MMKFAHSDNSFLYLWMIHIKVRIFRLLNSVSLSSHEVKWRKCVGWKASTQE